VEFIRIENVEKVYKTGVTAIYGLNLKIKKGDFAFIIGASGSGK
jgi:cell division transport system ATP-binding protein